MGHIDIVVEADTAAEPLDRELAGIRGEMHSIIGELISKELVESVELTITHIGNLAEAAEPVADNLAKLLEQRSVAEVSRPGAAEQGITANVATVIERIDTTSAHGVRIRTGSRTHWVLSRRSNAEGLLRCNGLETDGNMAAAEVEHDGTIRRALAIEASMLRCHGQTLLDVAQPQNWSSGGAAE